MRAATLAVADLARSVSLYTRWLGYELVERDLLPEGLAASWGALSCAGRSYAVLRPASGKDIYLRLIEQAGVEGFRGLRTYGWNALEICVSDVLSVHDSLKDSPFEIIGPPRKNAGLANIHPMQIKGPDEEIIFLTQINDDTPPFRLPRASCPIDQIFIMVLGCSDMNSACNWFEEHLPLTVGEKMSISYTMLSKAYGKDPGTQFSLTTMVNDHDVFLEIDQYPDEAEPRFLRQGELPPGCALTTFWVPEWEKVSGPWISQPEVRTGCIYGGRRAGTMAGPDGVLIEIVEG